jgi:hypothetical protein
VEVGLEDGNKNHHTFRFARYSQYRNRQAPERNQSQKNILYVADERPPTRFARFLELPRLLLHSRPHRTVRPAQSFEAKAMARSSIVGQQGCHQSGCSQSNGQGEQIPASKHCVRHGMMLIVARRRGFKLPRGEGSSIREVGYDRRKVQL